MQINYPTPRAAFPGLKKFLINTIFAVMVTIAARGQAKTWVTEPDSSVSKRNHVLFGELLANGMTMSVNYDFRFGRSDKGLGMRMGVGFFYLFGTGLLTFPVTLNYVAGKAPHYVEASLGLTCANATYSPEWVPLFIPGIAYRYQSKTGFFAKFTICPVIAYQEGGGAAFFGGIAFGHKLTGK